MKIAIPSTGNDQNSEISPIFGRCPFFIIIETEDRRIKNFKSIQNSAASAFGGAGIQAAQLIANEGVEVVICGSIGPNAFNVLTQARIKVIDGVFGISVKEAAERFLKGEIKEGGTPPSGPGPMPPGPVGPGMGPGRPGMGPGMRPGRGRGYGGPVECVCPNCGFRMPHQRGVPCFQHICPRCGSRMVRG